MNTSISRCEKDNFIAYRKINDTSCALAWGVRSEKKHVKILNEETQSYEFKEGTEDSGFITYESGVYNGLITIERIIYTISKAAQRKPTISEWKAVFDAVDFSEEEKLSALKNLKIEELMAYDESSEVNDCIIVHNGEELHYWASKDERNDLKNAVRDCMAMGRDTYRLDLRDNGISIGLKCELLLQMMAALEVYAIDCYNKTTDHRFAIEVCKTEGEVDAYEFRGVGYPAKCRFEV